MVKNSDGLLRVFWPNNVARTTTPGVVVGWRNTEFDLLVVAILEDADVRIYLERLIKMTDMTRFAM